MEVEVAEGQGKELSYTPKSMLFFNTLKESTVSTDLIQFRKLNIGSKSRVISILLQKKAGYITKLY